MNVSTSECSSGCESGWTTYLDQFSDSTNSKNTRNYVQQNYEEKRGNYVNEDDEMVSDASSGPPNLRVGPHYYGYASSVQEENIKKKNKKKNNKAKDQMMKMQQNYCLDDTASSPNLHQDNAVLPPDQNHYSVEHLSQDESASKKRFGFLKSSAKGKSGSFLGRKRQ